MEENEFIKIAKFLDDNGAFSVADELENDFVKVAETKPYERDPNLPEFDQGLGGKVESFMNYVGGGIMNVFAPKRTLLTDRLYETRSFILSPIAKTDKQFASYLWEAINNARASYGTDVDPDRDNKLMTAHLQNFKNYDDMWNEFGNWVQFCRQLLMGQKKAYSFLSGLTKAEQYLGSKVDPDYKPKVLEAPKPSDVKSKIPDIKTKETPKTVPQAKPTKKVPDSGQKYPQFIFNDKPKQVAKNEDLITFED